MVTDFLLGGHSGNLTAGERGLRGGVSGVVGGAADKGLLQGVEVQQFHTALELFTIFQRHNRC